MINPKDAPDPFLRLGRHLSQTPVRRTEVCGTDHDRLFSLKKLRDFALFAFDIYVHREAWSVVLPYPAASKAPEPRVSGPVRTVG